MAVILKDCFTQITKKKYVSSLLTDQPWSDQGIKIVRVKAALLNIFILLKRPSVM